LAPDGGLRVRDLTAGYGGVPALHGVSLEVRPGEMVALLGANGAGKSTLLRAISGLLRPARGSVEFQGSAIERRPAHEIVRKGMAHVPEGRRLFGRLSVRDNLLLGAYGQRDEKWREDGLARVHALFPVLAERSAQTASTLSGGEQQMLAIGRALMSRPSMLLLDEPSIGIAPKLVLRIFEALREINQRGVTMLVVEQNVRAALAHAHRAYVLQTGRVVAEGPAAELLQGDLVRKAFLGI
jgi:branched-chain amino acid transport system ATP-binding protein